MTSRNATLHRSARYVKTAGGSDNAWFYEAERSIQVYCHRDGQASRWCRIPIAMLEDYVRRVKVIKMRRKK